MAEDSAQDQDEQAQDEQAPGTGEVENEEGAGEADDEFVDGVPEGDDIPDESDDPNANRAIDVEDDEV